MDFDKILEALQYVLPALATIIAAKYVNVNSKHWTLWTGRVGKILGLLVSLLDVLRSPKKIGGDILPSKTKKEILKMRTKLPNVTLLLLVVTLFAGCAGWQLTGKTWQENADQVIDRTFRVTHATCKAGLPVVREVCTQIKDDCVADPCPAFETCMDIHLQASNVCLEAINVCRMAAIAVAAADEGEYEKQAEIAAELLKEIVRTLGRYGAI
jgi:di/tricarboxylate transporter